MFKFRLLLLFVGVCGVILGTDSYTYPSAPAYPQQESYGYGGYSPPAYPSYSSPSYGSYGKGYSYGYGSSYSANCEYMKVIEVLDQIFCQHAYKQRYSSTIYPTIDTIIEQLEWTYELVFIQDVYDYIVAAIHELKTLQDAVYNTYGDSSLLQYYDEYYYDDKGGDSYGGSGQTSGTSGAGSNRVSAKTKAANKLTSMKSQLNDFESKTKEFKTQEGVNFQQQKHAQQSQQNNEQQTTNEESMTVIEVDVSKVTSSNRKRSVNQKLLAKARSSRSAYLGSRKTRGAEYSDYTCSYLAPIYCSEDKYDELLYNILDRLYTAWDFLYEALEETWDFMEEIDCESRKDKKAFREAAISFGAILTSFYTLNEVAEDVERMYEIMELDYGYDSGSYYRAGGSGDESVYTAPTQPGYSSGPNRPSPSYVNKPPSMPSYPYSGYISQPVNNMGYSVPQQYRYQRSAVTPAVPHVFLVG